MSASQPSEEDLRNREMFKAMFSTPLEFVEESLEDLGLACERLLAKIVDTVEKNKRTGIGLKGFKAGTNFMPMVVLSAANIDTVVEAVGRRGRADDLFKHLAILFKGLEANNYPEVQDLKILTACLLTRVEKGASIHKIYENKSQRSLLDVMARCTNNEVFDGLVEVVLLTLGRNMEHVELVAKDGVADLSWAPNLLLEIGALIGPRDLLAWEGVMHNKCKQRTLEGGCSSEASQRWQLLTSRVCLYLLRMYELLDGALFGENASAVVDNCLSRCQARFFDEGVAENSRFVHFATLAKLCLMHKGEDSERHWKENLATQQDVIPHLLDMLPHVLEGEWETCEAEVEQMLPKIMATLEFLEKAFDGMSVADKRWLMLLVGRNPNSLDRIVEKLDAFRDLRGQIGTHFSELLVTANEQSDEIREDYENSILSLVGFEDSPRLSERADQELKYVTQMLRSYETQQPTMLKLCWLFYWNISAANICLWAEGKREGFVELGFESQLISREECDNPHLGLRFWCQHLDTFASIFHGTLINWHKDYLAVFEFEEHLEDFVEESGVWLEEYVRLLDEKLLPGRDVAEAIEHFTALLEGIGEYSDLSRRASQELWCRNSQALYKLVWFCVHLCTRGMELGLEDGFVRACIVEIQGLGRILKSYDNMAKGDVHLRREFRASFIAICKFLATPAISSALHSPAAPATPPMSNDLAPAQEDPAERLASGAEAGCGSASPRPASGMANGTRSESSDHSASSSAPEREEVHAGASSSNGKAGRGGSESEVVEERRLVPVNVACAPPALPYPPHGETQVRGEHSAVWQCQECYMCDCGARFQ